MAIERTNLNMIKGICDKCIANIIPNGEKLEAFPLTSGTDMDVHSCHVYAT